MRSTMIKSFRNHTSFQNPKYYYRTHGKVPNPQGGPKAPCSRVLEMKGEPSCLHQTQILEPYILVALGFFHPKPALNL